MGFEFLEDVAIADVAFRAWGDSLGEVFSEVCEATLAIMVADPDAVAPARQRQVAVEAESAELLLFDLIGELVYLKDAEGLLLRPRQVTVSGPPQRAAWRAEAVLVGEPVDPSRHEQLVDVKAVTLHRFCLERGADGTWRAQVVVDV